MWFKKILSDKVFFRAAFLVTLGVALVVFRVVGLGFPILPDDKIESWHVEIKYSIQPGTSSAEAPVNVRLFLPQTTRGYAIVDENFITNSYGLTTAVMPKTQNRVAEWTRKKDSKARQFYYRAILYKSQAVTDGGEKPVVAVNTLQYGTPAFNEQADKDVVYGELREIIEELNNKFSAPEKMILGLHQTILNNQDSPRIKLFKDYFEPQSTAHLMVQILRHAGMPIRVANGVELHNNQHHVNLEQRLELFKDGSWHGYNPKSQKFDDNADWMVWWVGSAPIVQAENATVTETNVSYKRHVESQLTEAIWKGSPVKELAYKFSVFSLPVEVQLLFVSLFMLPLGALVVAIIRQMIGIVTFGTFMPVLVALALRETMLVPGLMMFGFIIFLGTITRGYLSHLQLLMVPRLTAILVVVVGCIYLLSILAFMTGMQSGLSMSLFPIVILTMMIERVSITIEESGLRDAMVASAGSLFVAVVSYFVMTNHYVIYWISTFPELLLIVLAACLLLGRYNGYKLMEYYRFRMLAAKG